MIDDKEIPEYKIFTEEPALKRKRRHKKHARELNEANEIKRKMDAKSQDTSLEQQLLKRQEARESNYNSMMDKLLKKYGNDEDDSIAFEVTGSKRSSKKKIVKRQPTRKVKERSIRNGRVQKDKN